MSRGDELTAGDSQARADRGSDLKVVACLFSHTEYSLWGLHLVERILRELWGHYHYISCQDLAGLRDAWVHRGDRHVLIASDAPKEELIRLLSVTGIPCLIFLDEPMRLIELAIYTHGVHPMDALRGCTHFFTSFSEAISLERALTFRCEEMIYSAETMARQIIDIFWDENARSDREAVASSVLAETPALPAPHGETQHIDAALHPDSQSRVIPKAKDLEIIRSVVNDYRALYRPEGMSVVAWPRELFFTSNPDQARPEEILLAGDARVLIRGPYCSLPAGRWRVSVEFEVADHISGDSVEADVVFGFGAGVLTRGLFVLPARGIFRYALDFHIDEAKPSIETRLRTLKAAIRGVLCLRSVTATRLAARGAQPGQAGEPAAPEDRSSNHDQEGTGGTRQITVRH